MATFYAVRVADAAGSYQTTVANFIEAEGHALDYALNVGRVGVLQLTIPATFRPDLFIPERLLDGRFGVWRSINGRTPKLDGDAIFLARIFEYTANATIITAFHVNELFARRIIAYASGSSFANKAAAAADNQVKAFISENMGSSISGANRDGAETGADISAYVSVAANLAAAASIAMGAARRNLLDVVTELGQASTTNSTYLTTEITDDGAGNLQARTYTTARGVNRGSTSTAPLVVSEENGRLKNAKLTLDYSKEVTFAIAGGADTGTNRLIRTQLDATRMAMTPFNRREQFIDMSNITDATQLQNAADAAVRNGRPTRTLTGDLQETPSFTRGIHYDLGDILIGVHPRSRQQFDVRLDALHEVVSPNSRQSEAQFRGTT